MMGVVRRALRWIGGLTLIAIIVFIVILVTLLVVGVITPLYFILLLIIGVPLIAILAVLAIPIAVLGLIIPFAIILAILVVVNMVLSLVLSAILTVIVLWVADRAFTDTLGVSLLPLREDGSIVWWRVFLAILLFLSIYSLVSRITVALGVEARRRERARYDLV